MRKAGGVIICNSADGKMECDTFTCSHCQRIVAVKARARPEDMGGHCRVCDKLICKTCVGNGCTPWEKQMERMEARQDALRSYGF